MTEPDEFCPWLEDEGDLIDKIDSRIQIVSTSPSSNSHSSHNLQPVKCKSDRSQQNGSPDEAAECSATISKSCDDLLNDQSEKIDPFSRSQSCLSLSGNVRGKYDHVQSKIKQYIDILNPPAQKEAPKQAVAAKASKEEYLEEINSRLIRELEEKNSTLLQLQENYEHLLLKYAEAQNKIDNLRFKSSANVGESSSRSHLKSKLFLHNVGKPSVYSYKNPATSECQRAVVAPFTKVEGPSEQPEVKIDRPSTLAVDATLRVGEKDGLKAVTPTDSEGVSSVITSMSGHSKILTNFDDRDGEQNKKTTLKSDVLEKSLPVNDPFDKVTHWQNSLPPLEMIETPDTGLYDLESGDPITSLSTRYHELPVSELENIPETPEWAGQQTKGAISQLGMKKYLRTLSLPSSLTRRNILSQIYKRRNNHTIDVSSPLRPDCISPFRSVITPENAVAAVTPPLDQENTHPMECNILLKRKKRPPFLRSSSLPMYEYESPRSMLRCNVPPLDLDNLTLSDDDETSPVSRSNALTSPSFLTSHDCSFQTLTSLNSCKATVSDYSPTSVPRQVKPVIHKSTSITPDRSKEMFFYEGAREFATNCCSVCGEVVLAGKAASFHGIHLQSQDGEAKFPICRSVSFNTESSSPTHGLPSLGSHDPTEAFDQFTNNLKTRSQITMKALTAHVNNS